MKAWVVVAAACFVGACSGAPEIAAKNRTFYDWAAATGADGAAAFEQRYPPLDLAEQPPRPEYIGVTVLRGGVHLSRPKDWVMRDADNAPGQAHVQYVSPNAYAFSLYERPESPGELWHDVMSRYAEDVQSLGAKIVGGAVPMATQRGQGRVYTVERTVEAAKRPLVSRSREFLVRGDSRVVLVQLVVESGDLPAVDEELLRVINTLEVR